MTGRCPFSRLCCCWAPSHPDLTIARWEGVVLLIIFAFILTYQIRTALQNREQLAAAAAEAETEEAEAPMSAAMIWVNILLGLACIVIGGQLAVNGATGIARMFGLSETLIGLTIVAMGTSLPELVTSIVAARKGQNDIAMGNVIGSNLFNIFLILAFRRLSRRFRYRRPLSLTACS